MTISQQTDSQLWDRAQRLMPRGVQTMSKHPSQFTDVYPRFIERGEGPYVFDRSGRRYIDLAGSLGPIILGHNHEQTNSAILDQLKKGIVFSLSSTLESDVAELIIDTVPSVEMVRFAKNGSDVTSAAVRCARAYTGREHIAYCGYHGWSDSLGIVVRPPGIPSALKDLIHKFVYNNLPSLEEILNKYDVGAVILEAQALEAPASGFLEGIRSLCDRRGAVLIFDEVVTGYRWALGGAQARFKVMPDLTCLGKAVANGMPLSVIGGRRELMMEFERVFFSSTFGGECLSLAAARATINELKTKDYDHIWSLGTRLKDGLTRVAKKHDLKARIEGSAPRLRLDSIDPSIDSLASDVFFQEMCKRRVLFSNVIYTTFAHTPEIIDEIIDVADVVFNIIASNVGNLDKILEGTPSDKAFLMLRG